MLRRLDSISPTSHQVSLCGCCFECHVGEHGVRMKHRRHAAASPPIIVHSWMSALNPPLKLAMDAAPFQMVKLLRSRTPSRVGRASDRPSRPLGLIYFFDRGSSAGDTRFGMPPIGLQLTPTGQLLCINIQTLDHVDTAKQAQPSVRVACTHCARTTMYKAGADVSGSSAGPRLYG